MSNSLPIVERNKWAKCRLVKENRENSFGFFFISFSRLAHNPFIFFRKIKKKKNKKMLMSGNFYGKNCTSMEIFQPKECEPGLTATHSGLLFPPAPHYYHLWQTSASVKMRSIRKEAQNIYVTGLHIWRWLGAITKVISSPIGFHSNHTRGTYRMSYTSPQLECAAFANDITKQRYG